MAAAVAAVLVGGTAAVTKSLTGSVPARSAEQVPVGGSLRTGTFQSADGQVLGQIVAYDGGSPWVYLNVGDPGYDGPVTCTLQVEDGSTVAFGTFAMHGGVGQFTKGLGSVDVGRLRGAKLVTSSGSPIAAATFGA